MWYHINDWQVFDMHAMIYTFSCPDGEIQRVHLVRPSSWEDMELLQPETSDRALDSFARIYEKFLVPAAPWVFGSLVLFRLPKDMEVPFSRESRIFGRVSDPLTAAAIGLQKGVSAHGKRIRFRNEQTKHFWEELDKQRCIRIIRGKLPITRVIPVGDETGFLTETKPEAQMKVNGSFFTMDPFDCATPYDHIGRPFGLFVKNGIVHQPPLFSREAFMVKDDGTVTVENPELGDLKIRIGDKTYIHGKNAHIYERPARAWTPAGRGKRLVIAGNRVEAVREGGCVPIPSAGFVLCPFDECDIRPGDPVIYGGLEDVRFGIQVGNSMIRDGVKTEAFRSRFFNIRGFNRISFPPCLYPLDYRKSRAARIAIGADRDGKPMVLWAEGAAKIGHIPGKDSQGASLADMARICSELGMVNGVNLDGGGSAQILLRNQRSLNISDRAEDGTETERPVPMGLTVL